MGPKVQGRRGERTRQTRQLTSSTSIIDSLSCQSLSKAARPPVSPGPRGPSLPHLAPSLAADSTSTSASTTFPAAAGQKPLPATSPSALRASCKCKAVGCQRAGLARLRRPPSATLPLADTIGFPGPISLRPISLRHIQHNICPASSCCGSCSCGAAPAKLWGKGDAGCCGPSDGVCAA